MSESLKITASYVVADAFLEALAEVGRCIFYHVISFARILNIIPGRCRLYVHRAGIRPPQHHRSLCPSTEGPQTGVSPDDLVPA